MKFKGYLESIGDSIVVVSDDDIVKVHVHTNHPGLAIREGADLRLPFQDEDRQYARGAPGAPDPEASERMAAEQKAAGTDKGRGARQMSRESHTASSRYPLATALARSLRASALII